jgi:hypothetical protein
MRVRLFNDANKIFFFNFAFLCDTRKCLHISVKEKKPRKKGKLFSNIKPQQEGGGTNKIKYSKRTERKCEKNGY